MKVALITGITGQDGSYLTGLVRVIIDPKYFRPAEIETLLGDASKAKKKLGWEPKTSFKKLVEDMCVNE